MERQGFLRSGRGKIMKIAYLDCFSGISGDMFLSALLDAGLPFPDLQERLSTLPLGGYRLVKEETARNHIHGTTFSVHCEGTHHHRNFKDIQKIISKGSFSEQVKEKSIQIFRSLAVVEGRIHAKPPEAVHFHEVGAVDSIIDIVGGVYGVEKLGIHSIFASKIPLGSGFVKTAHGRMPLPAPATIALLGDIPVFDSGVQQEMVTPTGAALLKGLAVAFGEMPAMKVHQIGYGAGSRDLPDRPNMLRILIGEQDAGLETDTVAVLEANIDDMSPEGLGYLMERLFEAGALDVAFFPAQMKKSRPGVQVQVIGYPPRKDRLMEVFFSESSTLGVRFQYTERKVLQREATEVESPWGRIRVKSISRPNGTRRFDPEYDVCRDIARNHSVSLEEVYTWVKGLRLDVKDSI